MLHGILRKEIRSLSLNPNRAVARALLRRKTLNDSISWIFNFLQDGIQTDNRKLAEGFLREVF